jgi:hypothetical protein
MGPVPDLRLQPLMNAVTRYLQLSNIVAEVQLDSETNLFWAYPLNGLYVWISTYLDANEAFLSANVNFGVLRTERTLPILIELLAQNAILSDGLHYSVEVENLVIIGFHVPMSLMSVETVGPRLNALLIAAQESHRRFVGQRCDLDPLPRHWLNGNSA